MEKHWTKKTLKEVFRDKSLTSFDKLLYSEIVHYSRLEGYCYAGNSHLAEIMGKSEKTISRTVAKLKKLEFVTVVTRRGNRREIYPGVEVITDGQECPPPADDNVPSGGHQCPSYNKGLSPKAYPQRDKAGEPPPASLSFQKFSQEFPRIELNKEFQPFHNVTQLINAVNKSRWLQANAEAYGLKWLLHVKRYAKAIDGEYANYFMPADPKAVQEKQIAETKAKAAETEAAQKLEYFANLQIKEYAEADKLVRKLTIEVAKGIAEQKLLDIAIAKRDAVIRRFPA